MMRISKIKIVALVFCVDFMFAYVPDCSDAGAASSTAKTTAKTALKAADKALAAIIKQIKSDEEDIKDKNDDTAKGTAGAKKYLRNTQQLDSNSVLSGYQVIFNAEVINNLESVLVDTKAESKHFEISQELENLSK